VQVSNSEEAAARAEMGMDAAEAITAKKRESRRALGCIADVV
jgi:hypothetical protein